MKSKYLYKITSLVICLLIAGFVLIGAFSRAFAAQLTGRSLQLSTATASATADYDFSFNLISNSSLGSISFQFCSNDAIVTDSCTAPAGFSDSAATLSSQSGQTGFSINPSSTVNHLIISRTAAPATPGQVNYVFSNITNPSSTGAYFVRITTYSSTDGSGSYIDYGGIAFAISSSVNISATVPPYLIFCTGLSIPNYNCSGATGDFINFGNLSPSTTATGSSQMLAATNAASGYDITVYGTTLESGNQVINNLATPDVSRPGTSQFGMNLRANVSPAGGLDPSGPGGGSPSTNYNRPNFFSYNSGDVVASSPQPDPDRLYTASYMVNVSSTQAPGVYVTTLTYICVATF